MRRDRRWLLQAFGTSLVAGCAPATGVILPGTEPGTTPGTDPATPVPTPTLPPSEDPFTDGVWQPEDEADWQAFPRGVQTGDVQQDSAILGVRDIGDSLTFELIEQQSDRWRVLSTATVEAGDLGYRLQVDGLLPDTEYRWFARTETSRSVVARFRTPPTADQHPIVRFGATSCMGGNRPWPLLSEAAAENLDVFLLLGDTVYADWGADEPVAAKWDEAMEQDGMIDLTSSTSIIATWDDHEVDNNWSPAFTAASVVEEARRAFRDALPQREGPDGAIWRKLSWGGTVDFFVLDCRGERAFGQYVSPAQLDWLIQELADSEATFKIILNSVPATDLSFIPIVGLIEAQDRWQGYPAQRNQLMQAAGDTPGVLFVSGDFHVGAATFVDPGNGSAPDVMEVLVGPGGSAVSNVYSYVPVGPRIPRLVPHLNYTSFTCDPTTNTIDVEWIDNAGNLLDSLHIEFN